MANKEQEQRAGDSQERGTRQMENRKYADGADVCIVGAGAAGGVLAYELAKAGLRVVVLEAGPFGTRSATLPATNWRCSVWPGRRRGW